VTRVSEVKAIFDPSTADAVRAPAKQRSAGVGIAFAADAQIEDWTLRRYVSATALAATSCAQQHPVSQRVAL
jgi:hypothetical protein